MTWKSLRFSSLVGIVAISFKRYPTFFAIFTVCRKILAWCNQYYMLNEHNTYYRIKKRNTSRIRQRWFIFKRFPIGVCSLVIERSNEPIARSVHCSVYCSLICIAMRVLHVCVSHLKRWMVRFGRRTACISFLSPQNRPVQYVSIEWI